MFPTGQTKDNPKHSTKMHTTTVRIPGPIYTFAKEVVESGEAGATTLDDLVVWSLDDRLKKINEAIIDARLAHMAKDDTYEAAAVELYELYDASASENLPAKAFEPLRPARAQVAHARRAEALND